MSANVQIRCRVGSSLLIAAVLLSGCATTTVPTEEPLPEVVSFVPEPTQPEYIPVLRSGRYTLVEFAPSAAQRDLLRQVVQVSLPEDAGATVGDGLRHTLKRSGYQLCETALGVIELYSLPLPLAHVQLGPMTLRDALVTLAGPAWELQSDDVARQICFTRSNLTDSEPERVNDMPADEPVQTFPVSVTGALS